MKTLDEHNRERMESMDVSRQLQEPRPNGISCPECGSELWDSDPQLTLSTNPPLKYIHCQCGYTGYRIA